MGDSIFHGMSDDENLEKFSELFKEREDPMISMRKLCEKNETIKEEMKSLDGEEEEMSDDRKKKINAEIWNKLYDKQ